MADYDISSAFEAIENELIDSMIRNFSRHRAEETKEGYNWSQWQAEQLKSLERYRKINAKKFNKRVSEINGKVAEMLKTAREDGSAEQEVKILQAISNGLFHPRCKDSTSTYYEGITTLKPANKEEINDMRRQEIIEQQKSYYENQAKKCRRISDHSLDEENKKVYAHRAEIAGKKASEIAQTVAKSKKNGIIKLGSDEMAEITQLGKINIQPLTEEFGKIKTDEIIVTNERIEHIKLHHPQDYDLFIEFGLKTVHNPDIIIKDSKNAGTVFMVKNLSETNLNVIVRLVLEEDDSKLKNSVMTFYRIRNKNLDKLIKKNKLLYKKE